MSASTHANWFANAVHFKPICCYEERIKRFRMPCARWT